MRIDGQPGLLDRRFEIAGDTLYGVGALSRLLVPALCVPSMEQNHGVRSRQSHRWQMAEP